MSQAIVDGFLKQAANSEYNYEKLAALIEVYNNADDMQKEAILKMLSPGLRKKIKTGVATTAIALSGGQAKAMDIGKTLKDNSTTISRAVKGTDAYQTVKGGVKQVERGAKEKLKDLGQSAKDTVFGSSGKAMKPPPGMGGAAGSDLTNTLNVASKATKDGLELTGKSSPVKTKLSLNKLRLSKGDLSAQVTRKGDLSAKYKNFSGNIGKGGNLNVAYQVNPNLNVKGFTGPGGSGASFGANWSF